jgi:hypothetical protein
LLPGIRRIKPIIPATNIHLNTSDDNLYSHLWGGKKAYRAVTTAVAVRKIAAPPTSSAAA